MSGTVIIDTNLFGLLVVGTASRKYIGMHKRFNKFSEFHFDLLGLLLLNYDEVIFLPQIVAETSNLIRYIADPARRHIQAVLKQYVEQNIEIPLTSKDAISREEFLDLGVTDCAILHLCDMSIDDVAPTLITVDSDLANRANSLGYSVINYLEYMV